MLKKMKKKEKILIVDDDESLCKTLSAIFRKQDYEVDIAATGQKAQEKVREKSYNIAFLDIKLPDMDGIELMPVFKKEKPDMEVIMITGYASVDNAVNALNTGASAYLIKPLNMDKVLIMIRNLLEKQQLITEKQKAEEDLVLALEKAQESDRLKSAFLMNMSHEIRTPMNGILGFAKLLKKPQLTRDELNSYIEIIEQCGDRLLNTINNIIDISKIEAGQVKIVKTEVSVNKILEEQYAFFNPEAKSKGLELIYKPTLSDKEAIIVTDKHKLEGILTNLIKNAIKFTEFGNISFGYSIKKGKDFKELNFYVKDTGIGIPSDRIHAIFNRFEKADIENSKVYEGAGLGLAISKSYVEMLGGKIWVSSKEGYGSTFTFSIPYIQPSTKNGGIENNEKKEQKTSLTDVSVIIAEDDESSQLLLKTVLKNKFRKIIYTTSGEETIEAIKKHPEINIILMDIKMPGMNGYDATREIRKFNRDVIIIAQTAFGFPSDKEKAIKAGCDDYIAKPINIELLFEMIMFHLSKKAFNK